MKATITSLIFLLLSLTVSSQTYKYIGIEEGLSNQKIYKKFRKMLVDICGSLLMWG